MHTCSCIHTLLQTDITAKVLAERKVRQLKKRQQRLLQDILP